MKTYLLVIIGILCHNLLLCQNSLIINPQIGVRMHTSGQEGFTTTVGEKLLTSSVIGLNVGWKNFPILVGYSKDYNVNFSDVNSYFNPGFSVKQVWTEDQVSIIARFDNFGLSIGHYWKNFENTLVHLSPGSFANRTRGIQASFIKPFNKINVEFKLKCSYDPDIAILDMSQSSIIVLYNFNSNPIKDSSKRFIVLNGIIGSKFFINQIKLIAGEEFINPISLAPTIGVEFFIPKYSFSVNLEKDWWFSFNGGSPSRDLKSFISNSSIGLKYHLKMKNNHHFRMGAYASWIEDSEVKLKIVNEPAGSLGFSYFQVKGLGLTLSYEIIKNTDLEFRTLVPFYGEKFLENTGRTSLGLFYRFNQY